MADDPYKTSVNALTLAEYESAYLMRLRKPELALPIHNKVIAAYDPTDIRHRSFLLARGGKMHAQIGEVKTACKLLLDSLGITEQMKSLVMLQRIYQGRVDLEPWKDRGEVKELDERIVEVYKSLGRVKELV